MVDRAFSDTAMAELYEAFCYWGCSPADDFYLDLVMSSRSVLDVGCGTGLLQRVARERGHTGRLVGLDPAAAMLAVARRGRDDVDWVLGDLASVPFAAEFDLVVMTGHAFQVFTTDAQLEESLAAVRAALTPQGRFLFETRNPAVRGWEDWRPDRPRLGRTAEGVPVRAFYQVDRVEGDLVTFTYTYDVPWWDEPRSSVSTLRFLDADALDAFLGRAGLEVSARYGDWDRGALTAVSPEIITFTRPR